MTGHVAVVARRPSILLVAVVCLGLCLSASACGGSKSSSGDPGNRRLHELAGEAVFRVTPPGLRQPAAAIQTPAHKRPAGFGAGGWEGPSVTASFTTGAKPADVLGIFDAKATATGWRSTAAGAYGVHDRWTKNYADGTRAYLIMTVVPSGGKWSYRLAASAAAAAS